MVRNGGSSDERRGEHAEDAALADVGDLRDAHRREIERQRERLAVEVAGRDDLAGVREHERVVGDGVDLDGDDFAQPAQRVAAGAVHLRDAAQRVGVLHLVAVEVAEHDRAARRGAAHLLAVCS